MSTRPIKITALLMLATVSMAASAEDKRRADQDDVQLDEVIVLGTDPTRYQNRSTEALSGVPLDYMELPRIVEIIPEQLVLDQKITELEEALRNVPGISLSDGFGGSNNDFLIRGFRRNTVYRNGLRVLSNFRVNTSNVEKIQVVKGPASITYGQVEPGGLVDIVTKKPLQERRIYSEVRAGSYDSQFLLVDYSQPIQNVGAMRVNISSEQSDTFRDFFEVDRKALSLTGMLNLSDNTGLAFEYENRDEFRSFDRGTVTIPTPQGREIVNRVLDVDISTRFGEPFEEIDTEFEFGSVTLSHRFNDSWQAKLIGAFESSLSNDYQARPRSVIIFDADAQVTEDGYVVGDAEPQAVFDDPTDRVFLARRSDGSRERDRQARYWQVTLSGLVHTHSIEHSVVIGADLRETEEQRYFVSTPTTDGIAQIDGGNGPLFNFLNPIYGSLVKDVTLDGLDPITAQAKDRGLFVNDYMRFNNRIALLVGARLDYSDPDGDGPASTVSALSPQVALNYFINKNMTVFGSYSEAFEPNTAFILDDSGEPSQTKLFDPEDSRQYELGSKLQWFDQRLKFSATVYDILKSNVLVTVDDQPQLVDGQSSRGAELSLSGQPLVGMNLVAGYAYTDSEIQTGVNQGNQPRNTTDNTLNLWTSYEFQAGLVRGLGVGVGAFYMGDRYGDDGNSWKLGDYALLDASVWYNIALPALSPHGNLRLQLAAKNLTDEEYYLASGGDLRVSIGTPRSVVGSLSLVF